MKCHISLPKQPKEGLTRKIFLKLAGLNDQGSVAALGEGAVGKIMEKGKGKLTGKGVLVRSGREL